MSLLPALEAIRANRTEPPASFNEQVEALRAVRESLKAQGIKPEDTFALSPLQRLGQLPETAVFQRK